MKEIDLRQTFHLVGKVLESEEVYVITSFPNNADKCLYPTVSTNSAFSLICASGG